MKEEHQLNAWHDREGELIAASIFLSPEEVQLLRETGSLTIVAKAVE